MRHRAHRVFFPEVPAPPGRRLTILFHAGAMGPRPQASPYSYAGRRGRVAPGGEMPHASFGPNGSTARLARPKGANGTQENTQRRWVRVGRVTEITAGF